LVVHAIPAVQTLHVPLMQSMLLPHAVPSRAFGPSLHARLLEPHSMRPSRQGAPGFVVHVSSTHVEPSAAPPSTTPDDTPASTMPAT
jgi:hypothetical protein